MKMAPPGHHVVSRQIRISKTGIKFYVKAHVRKNRGRKIVLLPENILYLYWHGDQEYPLLGKIKGFEEFSELDSVIQFWLSYWKEFGLVFPSDLTPLLIKAIIAKESSFRPRASARGSTAYGLMQITDKTRRDVKNINDGIIDLERKDLEDPVISIAMGIRWLSYKYSSIGKGVKRNLYNTIKYYYDKNKGDEYAKDVLNLYNSSL